MGAVVRRAVVAGLICAACGGDPHVRPVSRAWPTMGTMMSVAAWGADSARIDRALDQVRDSVDFLDSLLSIYRDDSEIARINRRLAAEGVTAHFAAVLGEALAVARASGGAFDPTTRAWQGVTFDSARGAVRLRPGLALDFGGIAKGYALDRAALLLAGVADSALLDLGGQFYWVGPATGRVVGIADPDDAFRTVAAVELRAGSVSTSSQAEQPGHIVDPRTGRPAGGARSVTVLAPTGIAADAWSTAFFVLGCDGAFTLAAYLPRWRVSVVCADSAGVGWTDDLEGRVLLPTAPGRPAPARRPGPAPARAPAPSGSTSRSSGLGSAR